MALIINTDHFIILSTTSSDLSEAVLPQIHQSFGSIPSPFTRLT